MSVGMDQLYGAPPETGSRKSAGSVLLGTASKVLGQGVPTTDSPSKAISSASADGSNYQSLNSPFVVGAGASAATGVSMGTVFSILALGAVALWATRQMR